MTVLAGRAFADADTAVVVLEARAAGIVAGDSATPSRAIGRSITLNGNPHVVIGVVSGGRPGAPLAAFVPFDAAARSIPGTRAPSIVLVASVAERTREIGVRKSMGARDRDVLVQFLSESVVITGVGAAAGVALGLAIAFGVAAVMRAKTHAPVHAAITPATILIAAGLSVLIGIGVGLYPALRAARLSPIEAIRRE